MILPAVNRAHTFLVQMPRAYKDVSIESVVRLHEIIQLEKPANTSYCLRVLAEERELELREFFVIGERSGIGVGAEVVRPLPPGALLEEELIVAMKPSDAPVEETVDEFIAPNRGKAPLPKAPKAENAPIEGQEVRTNLAGGFDAAARETDLGEIERLLREQGVTTSTPGPEVKSEAKAELKSEAKAEAKVQAEAAAELEGRIEAARARAAQFVAERRYAEARQELELADSLESPAAAVAEPTVDTLRARGARILSGVRTRLQEFRPGHRGPKLEAVAEAVATEKAAEMAADAVEEVLESVELDPVEKSISTVSLYSKIAAGVGILPGGLLNFGAILAVQVTMVWKIANTFGHREGKDRIRGLILSLAGSALPTGVGAGVAYSVAAIPAATAGLVLGFVVTPVLAYALTQAVGNAFIMHFESGGTLLTFDPNAFRDHIIKDLETVASIAN